MPQENEIKAGLVAVEAILQFAVLHKLMETFDIVQKRNELYTLLKYAPEEIDEGLFGVFDDRADNETATEILTDISDAYAARGLFAEDTIAARDQLEAAVMGLLMPRVSEALTLFLLHYSDSPKKATDYFFELCRSANYIQVDRIKKDLYWQAETEYGALEITVNLSKPEKDPRDIVAARAQATSTYPRCLLCVENVGFAGTRAWPARQNLRTVPLTLDDDPWYFQYSPYAYYNEHCIVFSEKHEPMHISDRTFKRLVEFVNDFPHYFIGSNAGLPIVGGSILSHDHFQGGRHVFPMEKAEPYAHLACEGFPGVELSLVKWPMSVVRLTSRDNNEQEIIALATRILEAWQNYSDPDAGIISATGETPHNAITPIVRFNREDRLEMDMVLRNNRTTDEHPLGIFHPHAEWHHIKKENIGLIEVMGLAVLPGRLRDELSGVATLLTGGPAAEKIMPGVDLTGHQPWIDELTGKYGNQNTPEAAEKIVRDEVGRVFENVLHDCGVFKDNDEGRVQFMRFMATV